MAMNLYRVPGTKLFINVAPAEGSQWAKLATFCFYHHPDTQAGSITVEQTQTIQGTYAFLRPNPAAPFGTLESKLAHVVQPQGHLLLWMMSGWDIASHELSVVNGAVQSSLTLDLWSFNALIDSKPGKGSLKVIIPNGTQATLQDDQVVLVGADLQLLTVVDKIRYWMKPLNQQLQLCLEPGAQCTTVKGQLAAADTAVWIAAVTPQVRYIWKANAFSTIKSSRILSSNAQDHTDVIARFQLHSFDAGRDFTSIALLPGANGALKSCLSDTNRHEVGLTPAKDAAIYFEQHPNLGNYASLRGKFKLCKSPASLDGKELPVSRDVMPGCIGTEFFQLGKDGYDGLEFVPGQHAFVQFAVNDEPLKLTDGLTTAWIAPCRTGPTAAWATEPYSFVAQPQQEPLYGRRVVDVAKLPKSPSADSIVFFDPAPTSVHSEVSMPFFPFRGMPQGSPDQALQLDLQALAPMRSKLAAEGKKAAMSALARTSANARTWITTPQGLLVQIDTDNEWHAIKLAEGSKWEMTIERPKVNGAPVERWALQEALSRSEVFVVVSRQRQGDIPDTNEPVLDAIKLKAEISGWSLKVNLVSTSTSGGSLNEEPPPLDSGRAPVLILKLSKGPLSEMLGNVGRWALARVLNQSPESASRGTLKALDNLKTLSEGMSPLDGSEIARELKPHYQALYNKITNKDWTGVLVLNAHVPFDDVPETLLVVTKGAEDDSGKKVESFSVPVLGLDLSRVVHDEMGLKLDKTSAFGAIHYHSPTSLKKADDGFGFKLRQLNAIFDNSELRTFLATMQLRVGEFFGAETQRDEKRLMDIISRYEGQEVAGTKPKYTFRALGEYTMRFTGNAFLQALTVNRVDLTSRRIDKTVESRIGMWGELEFGKKFTDVTGIGKIGYQNAALVMKDTKTSNGEEKKTFGVDFGNVNVDFKEGGGTDGLLAKFPLKLSGMRWTSIEQSLSGIGFTQLKLPGFDGLDAPTFDFGLELDLNLGSMGKLFEAADFLKARILVGWYKSKSDKTGFSLGFRFVGGNGPLDIGVNGVFRLTAKDVNLKSYQQGIGIGLLDPQLEVMGYKVPAKATDTLVALLPTNESNVAWAWARLDTKVGPVKLDYFALGQRMELVPTDAFSADATLSEIIEKSRDRMKPGREDGGVTLPDNIGKLYNPDAGWGVVANGAVGTFKIRFVFLDGLNRYGLGVNLPNIADIDVIYRKLSDNVGVFSAQIVPGIRTLEMGAATVTLPIVGFDALTNGNWSINIGYHGNDFSRGTTVQLLPFLGSGGIRFGKLDWRSSYVLNSPDSDNSHLIQQLKPDPVIEMSFAARVGIGKEFREGVFSAGLTMSVYGIFEGALGRPTDPAFPIGAPNRYIKLAGTAGLLLEIFGVVNFAIVSAAVSIRVWVEMGLTLESWTPVVVHAEAGVSVFVRFVVARFNVFGHTIEIAINFSFATCVRFTQQLPYSFDGNNPYKTSVQQLAMAQRAALLAHECTLPLEWVKHKVADAPAHLLAAATIEPMLSDASPVLLPMLFASDSPGEEGLALFTRHLFKWALRLSCGLPSDAPMPNEVSLNDLSVLRGRLSPPKGTSLARWGKTPLDFSVLRDFLNDHLRLDLREVQALLAAQQDAMRLAGLAEPERPQGILLPWFADIAIRAIAKNADPVVLRDFRSTHSQPVNDTWERELFDRLSEAVPDYTPDECEAVKRLLVESGVHPFQAVSKEALDAIVEDWAAALLQGIAHRAWEAARDLVRAQQGKEDLPPDRLGTEKVPLESLLKELLASREGGSLAAQAGKHAGTFMHHGLRVPVAAGNAAAVPLSEFLRTEISLAELVTSNEWTLCFAPRDGFADKWITGTSHITKLPAQDADAYQRRLATKLGQDKIQLTAWLEENDTNKTTQKRRFVTDSLVPLGKSGSATPILRIAAVPSALSALALRADGKLKVKAQVEEPGKPKAGTSCPQRWFVKIDVQLEQKQGVQTNTRPVYSVLHIDSRIRTLYQQMIRTSLVEKVRLAYLKDESQSVPLQFVENQDAFLFVSNLSKEPRPPHTGLRPATPAETPTYSDLANAENLAQILWMAATVNAPGFQLAFKSGADPIKHLFEKAAIASVSMVFELKESEYLSQLVDGLLLDNALVGDKQVVSFTTPDVLESLTTTPDGQVAVIVERENPLYGLTDKASEDEKDLRYLAARYELVDYWASGQHAQIERGNVMPTRVNLDEKELVALADTEQPKVLRYRILVPVSKIAARTAMRASGVTQVMPPNPYELVGKDISELIDIGLRDGAGHYLDNGIRELKWKGPTTLLYRDAIPRLQELAGVDAEWRLKRRGNDAMVEVTLLWSAKNLFSTNPKTPQLAEMQRTETLAQFRRAVHAMAAPDFSAKLEVGFNDSVVPPPDIKQWVIDWLGEVCKQLESRKDADRECNKLVAALPAAVWPDATPKPVRMDVAVGFYRNPDLCDQRLLGLKKDGSIEDDKKKLNNDIASTRSPILPAELQKPADWKAWAGFVKIAFDGAFSLLRQVDGDVDTQATRPIGTSVWLLRRNMLATANVTASQSSFYAPEPLAKTFKSGSVLVRMPDNLKESVEAKEVDLNELAVRASGALETLVSQAVGEALCQWRPDRYARLAIAKRKMADAMASKDRLQTIVDKGPGVPDGAREKYRNACRADTRTCFAPSALVNVQLTPAPHGQIFLWGRVEVTPPESGEGKKKPLFSYSPVHIPLGASGLQGSFDFVVQWADAGLQPLAVIQGPMKVRPQYVEVVGREEEVDGYVPSDWYEVIWSGELGKGASEISVRSVAGDKWDIPLPLRQVPPTPTILRHTVLALPPDEDPSNATDLAAFVTKARRWKYGLSVLVPSADQDVAEVTVRFGDALSMRLLGADPLFEALVSFSHLESRIDKVATDLVAMGTADPNDLNRVVELFEEIATALSIQPKALTAAEPDVGDALTIHLRTQRSGSDSGFPVDIRWDSHQGTVRTLLLNSDSISKEGDITLTPDFGDSAQGMAGYLERGETRAAINGMAGLSPRHLQLSQLDVMVHGRASSSVLARRNWELLGLGIPISSKFIFETPTVCTPDDLIPRLAQSKRFDLSKGRGPQPISLWLCKLRDALFDGASPEKFVLDVTAQFKLELVKSSGSTIDMLKPLPALKSVPGNQRDWVEILANYYLQGMQRLDTNAKSTGELQLNVQVYPIGVGESQKPVLSLHQIFLPLAKVTDEAVQSCVNYGLAANLPVHQVAAFVFEQTRGLGGKPTVVAKKRLAIAKAAAKRADEVLSARLPLAADLASEQGRGEWAASLLAATLTRTSNE